MATVEIRNAKGKVTGKRELPADLFEAALNVPVMHQVVMAGMAAQRAGTHSTKTRGEVSGGGAKPWRQKGTGRARHGSIRSPIWSGGGVSHGPKPRNYSTRVNKKMKRAALRSALTDALRGGRVALVDELAFDGPRTKDALALLEALELDGRVLLVIAQPDEALEKSFRNLPEVKVAYPGNLSAFDVLSADRILFTDEALDRLSGQVSTRARTEEPTPDEAGETEDAPASPDEGEAGPDQGDGTEVEP